MATQERQRTKDWSSLDDDILIRAHLKGDKQAFQVLFKKYREMVARLVYSIVRETSLVDDVVQEVFLLVFRNLSKFRHKSGFKTWIYRIAVNEALRQMNRNKRWVPLPDGEAEQSLPPSTILVFQQGDSPERVIIESEQRALIQKALNTLKPAHRLALVLFYMEELSVEEIGEILAIPKGSVKSRLFYAREALKKVLEPLLGSIQPQESGSYVLQ